MTTSRRFIEAALTSDSRDGFSSFSLWDINTSAQLVNFKCPKGSNNTKCLSFIDNNHFMTALDNVIYTWSVFSKKCLDQKLFLPGKPSAMCSSPCGNYLVVGISEAIYIWQLKSGNLLAHLRRHSQTISALKMNQEGSFLITGGEDGILLAWPFADILTGTHHVGSLNLDKSRQDATGVNEPRFTWQHHSDLVTDIHVTESERCLSSSSDRTVNLYSYITGQRLACFTMPTAIWSLAMDKNETNIFAGGENGKIYTILTSSISLSLINFNRNEDENETTKANKLQLSGHSQRVTKLVISFDGTLLVSASSDSTCKVWSIAGRKMLLDNKHHSPVANLTTLFVPDSLSLTNLSRAGSQPKTWAIARPLRRDLYKPLRDTSIQTNDLFEEGCTPIVYLRNRGCTNQQEYKLSTQKTNMPLISVSSLMKKSGDTYQSPNRLRTRAEEVGLLKKQIKDLYLIAAKQVFKNSAHDSLKPYEAFLGCKSSALDETTKPPENQEPKSKKLKRTTPVEAIVIDN